MSKASTKQRIECFRAALPKFHKDYENYLANRKIGIRPKKNKK